MAARFEGTNVDVIRGDATAMDLPTDRFSGAVCLTMLHHVPSAAQQDQVFAELHRVLRPGGMLAGQDGLASDELEALHVDDTYVPIDPATAAGAARGRGLRGRCESRPTNTQCGSARESPETEPSTR